jgi:replicative DNA helicase
MIDTNITMKINDGLRKPDVIIVDYLDLMHFPGSQEERIKLSKLTGQLKQISQEQKCVVISPTQLNRE